MATKQTTPKKGEKSGPKWGAYPSSDTSKSGPEWKPTPGSDTSKSGPEWKQYPSGDNETAAEYRERMKRSEELEKGTLDLRRAKRSKK